MGNELYVVVGLGNPGPKYENTRHNLGFLTVDKIAEDNNITVKKLKFKALIGEGRIGGRKVMLVKPQTYMNNSGESVREIFQFYKLPIENLIVIYDDFDIDLGAVRIRKFGSAGTHNGMRSIIRLLGNYNFPRVRIGIGSGNKTDLVDFVTGGFRKDEVPLLEEAVTTGAASVEGIIKDGIDFAMNRYNKKKKRNDNE